MNKRQWCAVTLLLVGSIVAGCVRAYAQCGGQYGNGSSSYCNWGSGCQNFPNGVYYGFCVTVWCNHSLNCAPPWYYLQSECYVAGCWGNYFLDSCGFCSNGGN